MISTLEVLVAHQRKDAGSCLCGWGVDTGDLGRSHADHVLDEFERAGWAVVPWHQLERAT